VLIEESRDTSPGQRLDLPGLATSGIGLFALTYGFIEANTYGWASAQIIGALLAAAAALTAFITLELRQHAPMLDLSLFRNRTFSGANTAMFFIGLAMLGTFFYVSLYMQNVLGYSPVQAGAAFLPLTLLLSLAAPRAGKLSDRLGSRALITAGMTLLAIMLGYFSRLGAHASFWALLPGLCAGGIGMGMSMTPATAAVMRSVPVAKAGVGSAVLSSMRQVGGSSASRSWARSSPPASPAHSTAATCPRSPTCTASTTRSTSPRCSRSPARSWRWPQSATGLRHPYRASRRDGPQERLPGG
jgi:hypothetical protein